MNVRRFVILPIKISRAHQIVAIDTSISANIISCSGILADVKGHLQTGRDIQHIGEVSILFNSGRVHPLHHSVGYHDKPLQKCDRFMQIQERIFTGSKVCGFYQDAGTATDEKGIFLPYQVNIYLECKAKK